MAQSSLNRFSIGNDLSISEIKYLKRFDDKMKLIRIKRMTKIAYVCFMLCYESNFVFVFDLRDSLKMTSELLC